MKKKSFKLEFFVPDTTTELSLPLAGTSIAAGFPSPADDYVEEKLDLNTYIVRNPSATFFARARGESMTGSGINDGDLLVIDRSCEPRENSILICAIDGEFTVKRVKKIDEEQIYLMPDNPEYDPICVSRNNNLLIWGVVIFTIHKQY